jgi:fused signal recognition particle receptor
MVFGFLKDKLKKVAEIFTRATTKEEPLSQPVTEEPKAQKTPTKPVKETKSIKKPAAKPAPAKPAPKLVAKPELKHIPEQKHAPTNPASAKTEPSKAEPVLKVETKKEKGGFFSRLKEAITSKHIGREEFDRLFEEIEIDLLENNVALEVVEKMREDLWSGIATERLSRISPENRVAEALKQSLSELFIEPFDIIDAAKQRKAGDPYIIVAVGINGSGKTTTLAKLGSYFEKHRLPVVLAAGDTFRAAAIQQLEEHATRLNIPLIKQQYGADPAAVAYDAIVYAKANGKRVVLVDTAGRLHSNTNLMAELQKVVRVAKPHCTVFIGEATTGNDCVEQAVEFQKAVTIDGIVLSKVDVDERGGAALSISYVTRKPILFFGTGQRYEDIEPFEKKKVLASLNF